MGFELVIWDWNGTLADDVGASLLSVNDILFRRKLPPITMEQYYEYIDTPISRFYEHILDLNQVSMEVIAQEFQAGYAHYFSSLHVGTEQLLSRLQSENVTQVILSSAHIQNILRDLNRFGLRDYFDEILGADDLFAAGKVDRGKQWMQRQQIPAERMVMIGDTLHDFETAQAMGVPCILFSGGHQSRKDLLTARCPVVDSMEQLETLLFAENAGGQQ